MNKTFVFGAKNLAMILGYFIAEYLVIQYFDELYRCGPLKAIISSMLFPIGGLNACYTYETYRSTIISAMTIAGPVAVCKASYKEWMKMQRLQAIKKSKSGYDSESDSESESDED